MVKTDNDIIEIVTKLPKSSLVEVYIERPIPKMNPK